jgi:exopolyphosphatase/guanosine-5'-triphosphate,3'-diphosphate pyrophosphatase
MVATSMVREAANGREFAKALLKRTGCALEVLDGEAEARGIAAGVAGDPEFAGKEALRIVDLGGGSMEYVFRARGVVREVESFPLGAARLTRCLVAKPADALPRETIAAVEARTREVLGGKLAPAGAREASAAAFAGCGGVFTVSRLIFAVERGGDSPELPAAELRRLRDRLAALPAAERMKTPGLPKSQAEIFPVALSVALATAEWFGVERFIHSRRNLRHGLAEAELAKLAAAGANSACGGGVYPHCPAKWS